MARLERDREETEEAAVAHFQHWAKHAKVRESICGKCLSPEEKAWRIREIFGLPNPDEESAIPNGDVPAGEAGDGEKESNPVQPSPAKADGE